MLNNHKQRFLKNNVFIVIIKFMVQNISQCDMGSLFEDYTRKCRPYHFHTLSTYYMDVCVCVWKSINYYYLNSDLFLTQKPVKSEGTKGRRNTVLFNPFI